MRFFEIKPSKEFKTEELSISKKILFICLICLIFFGSLEIIQRVRYTLRSESTYWLFWGFNKNFNLKDLTANLNVFFGWRADVSHIELMNQTLKYIKNINPEKGLQYYSFKIIDYGDYFKLSPGEFEIKENLIYKINSKGFRGREFSDKKEKGIYRIVILGESSTFCIDQNEENAWPHLLEKKLQKYSPNVEVINAGIGSANIQNILAILKNEAYQWNPDMIILYANFNNWGLIKTNESQSIHLLNSISLFLQKWSLLYLTVREKIHILNNSLNESYLIYRNEGYYKSVYENNEGWEHIENKYDAFIKEAKKVTENVIVMSQWIRYVDNPALKHLGSEKDYSNLIKKSNKLIERKALDNGAVFIDMADLFNPLVEIEKKKLVYDNVHFTNFGTEVFSTELIERLKKLVN